MLKRYIFALFLITGLAFKAQVSLNKYLEISSQIKTLYNQKKFTGIYLLLSPEYKLKVKEKDFVDHLQKNIFDAYDEMESNEYLKEENDHRVFISHCKNGDLLMDIKINTDAQIEFFQLLPHQSIPRLKVLNYLSDNKKQNALDSLIDKTVVDYMQSPQNFGLSIGILKDGKEYFYNYGEVKRNSKILATNNTIYEIGALTKTFCGILLAKAIEEKKVKASDDIRIYLPQEKYPNLEVNEKPIQLVHLANHSSGLPRLPEDLQLQPGYDPVNPYKNYSRQMLLSNLKKVVLVSEPGKISEYSNFGMALLGIILERVYNKSFEELVKEKICVQNNMINTTIKLNPQQTELLANGYNTKGKETPPWDMGELAAAGGIKSTAKDMLIYLKQNLEEKDEAIKLSHQPTFDRGNITGMGWQIIKTKQANTLVWHNGGTFGFSSFCGFIKEKNCAVIVLSNSGTMVDYIALAIFKYFQQ